jgi:hypothetical protein
VRGLFWLGLGLAVGVYATRRATEAAHALTPAGMGANLADGLRELGAGLGAFGAEVRAGMTERERELSALVEHRTGTRLPSVVDAFVEPPTEPFLEPSGPSTRPLARPSIERASAPRARARRAGA